ncbi:hypothetical protein [Burkholderia cepacia]|uniref:hypothetical protein n=1 Tax=Burkholderia cepacia TaxID=292 RepID=UPI001C70B705|nr:hypothetical protein [Burkholderia cepacia]
MVRGVVGFNAAVAGRAAVGRGRTGSNPTGSGAGSGRGTCEFAAARARLAVLPVVGGGIALAGGIGAGCVGARWGAVGFNQPDGATGSTWGRGGVLLRGFGRACGSGFHSVGREYRPFWRGAIELTVCAVLGCTTSSSRCSALRGRSAMPRASSSPPSRDSLTPNDVSTQAANCRQPMPVNQGSPAKNSTTIATGVPIGPSTWAKPAENAWPSAFVSGPDSGLVSVQLATNTAAKPSHRRIEPRPASPPPPGSIACTRRQKRRRNQTAEMPNQPKTTVCML